MNKPQNDHAVGCPLERRVRLYGRKLTQQEAIDAICTTGDKICSACGDKWTEHHLLCAGSQDKNAEDGTNNPGYDALWLWFGLSYSTWLTLPRVEMHAMPDEWQARMAELLRELDEEFPNKPDLSTWVSVKSGNKFVKMPKWVIDYRHPDEGALNKLRKLTPNVELSGRV